MTLAKLRTTKIGTVEHAQAWLDVYGSNVAERDEVEVAELFAQYGQWCAKPPGVNAVTPEVQADIEAAERERVYGRVVGFNEAGAAIIAELRAIDGPKSEGA